MTPVVLWTRRAKTTPTEITVIVLALPEPSNLLDFARIAILVTSIGKKCCILRHTHLKIKMSFNAGSLQTEQ